MPQRAVNRRHTQFVQAGGDLAGRYSLGRIPTKDEFDVLDPLGDDRRSVFQSLVQGLGRSIFRAVESFSATIGVDLDTFIVPFVNATPHFVALSVERHDIAAVRAVATEKVALAGERYFAGEYTTGLFFLFTRTCQRTDGGGNHRAIVVAVELLAAGIEQATVVVFEDREELAKLPSVPNPKSVERLDDNGIDLIRLDSVQEALKIAPLVGFIPRFVVFKPMVDANFGTLDVFPLAKRVLGIGGTAEITDCGHWAKSLSIGPL